MCFIIGQLIAAGVLEGLLSRTDEWSYRIPFAIQWIWPAFLFPVLLFAPESPWHLVRHKRLEEAERSLKRLQRASANIDVKQTLATIVYTNNLEEELSVGTSYWDCFTGFERRRTEIACICFAGQVLSGSTFAYNASYFFEQVGLSSSVTYKLNLGGTGLALFGTLINWVSESIAQVYPKLIRGSFASCLTSDVEPSTYLGWPRWRLLYSSLES